MEYTYDPVQDNKKEFDSLVGKDIWVRVHSWFDGGQYYINLMGYTDSGVNYRLINAKAVDSNDAGYFSDIDNLGTHGHCSFINFLADYNIMRPRDIYTTEELLDLLRLT